MRRVEDRNWIEWKNHIFQKLDKIATDIELLNRSVNTLEVRISNLELTSGWKYSLFGLAGGLIPVVTLMFMKWAENK